MDDARKKRRLRKQEPREPVDFSDTETVIEYTTEDDEECARSRSESPERDDARCLHTEKLRWEGARDFFTLLIVSFVLLDLYARSHSTLWWGDKVAHTHRLFTDDNGHPLPYLSDMTPLYHLSSVSQPSPP